MDITPLVKGARYRIRKVIPDACHRLLGRNPGVCLYGMHHPIAPSGNEYNYAIQRFRPLRKSDSEIFREMIKLPKREKVT